MPTHALGNQAALQPAGPEPGDRARRATAGARPGLTDSVDGRAEGQQEPQAAVEQRQGHAQQRLQRFLCAAQPGARRVRALPEELVLPERKDRD